jgi:large subunit ribosomal protein L25
MQQMELKVQPRQRRLKGDNKRLRRGGRIPSVVYGGDAEPKSIAVSEHELELLLRGGSRSSLVFKLAIEGGKESEQTLLRAVERHPVTSRLVHLDFQRVNLDEEVEIEVPVHAVGSSPKGVRAGGILEHIHRAVTVRCKPLQMPGHLDADLSELDVHQTYHVSDLTLPEGVAVVDSPDAALFSIVTPAMIKETDATAAVEGAEAAAPAEPEVIGRKKESEES